MPMLLLSFQLVKAFGELFEPCKRDVPAHFAGTLHSGPGVLSSKSSKRSPSSPLLILGRRVCCERLLLAWSSGEYLNGPCTTSRFESACTCGKSARQLTVAITIINAF